MTAFIFKPLSLAFASVFALATTAFPVVAQEPPEVDAPANPAESEAPAASEETAPDETKRGEAKGQKKREAAPDGTKQRGAAPARDAEKAERKAKRDAERQEADDARKAQREAEKAAREAEKAAEKAARDEAAARAAEREKAAAEKAAAQKAAADKAAAEKAAAEKAAADKAAADKAAAEKAAAEAAKKANEAKQAPPEPSPDQAQDAQETPAPKSVSPKAAETPPADDRPRGGTRTGRPERGDGSAGRERPATDDAKQPPEPAPVDAPKAKQDPIPPQDAKAPESGDNRRGVVRGESRPRGPQFSPVNEKDAAEQLQEERAKADAEFEKAKRAAAPEDSKRPDRARRAEKFEQIRKQRRERVEDGGKRAVIEEPDNRRIILENDRAFVRHDEDRRFQRLGKRTRREKQKDGTVLSVYLSLGGVEIIVLEDAQGRLLRRSRRDRDGREIVLVDNRRFYSSGRHRSYIDFSVDLPPPRIRIPRDEYIIDYDDASEDDIFDALIAPPVERLSRGYSLDEVRYSHGLRDRMRRVDLTSITFAFGSWEVERSQYPALERIARAMSRILRKNPDEMFLVEGHTDAVGSDIDNLSLSDRRAEQVAIILSDEFRVPPENLTTQGYGEQYLKEETEGPSRINRRVAIRRITPLLSRRD